MKPVDPIHFFNSRGMAVMTEDFLRSENDKLRAENEELARKVKTLALRLRTMAGDTESSISINH
ncbi:hypothetical protein [Agrobacterium sp. CG674]